MCAQTFYYDLQLLQSIMFKIDWKIEIDGKQLQLLDSVEITCDTENLTDSALIKLPSMVYNRYIKEIEDIKRDMPVKISLGYDGELHQEFAGYIRSVEREPSGLVINCQDEIYTFNKVMMVDKKYDNPSVNDILNDVLKAVNKSLTLNCVYDFSFDKFTISRATALDVLKTIQDECKCMMYIRDGVFNVTPPFITPQSSKTVKYDTSKNIMADGYSLKYKAQEDRKLKVIAKGKDKDGKPIEKTKGEGGGNTATFDYKGIATEEMILSIAENMYAAKSYSGYEGTFQAWYLPLISKGDTVDISDSADPDRNGKYFVKAVTTSCGSGGITRKISLGKKLS